MPAVASYKYSSAVTAQEGASRAQHIVGRAVDTALDLPSRATAADASVHGAPVCPLQSLRCAKMVGNCLGAQLRQILLRASG